MQTFSWKDNPGEQIHKNQIGPEKGDEKFITEPQQFSVNPRERFFAVIENSWKILWTKGKTDNPLKDDCRIDFCHHPEKDVSWKNSVRFAFYAIIFHSNELFQSPLLWHPTTNHIANYFTCQFVAVDER